MLSQSTQLTDEAQTLARDGADRFLLLAHCHRALCARPDTILPLPNRTNEIVPC
jgi:hypothetical protein